MTYSLKYIVDSKRRHQAVQIPVKEWKKIEKELREAQLLLKLHSDLEESFEAITEYKRGKKKLKSAEEFLRGL